MLKLLLPICLLFLASCSPNTPAPQAQKHQPAYLKIISGELNSHPYKQKTLVLSASFIAKHSHTRFPNLQLQLIDSKGAVTFEKIWTVKQYLNKKFQPELGPIMGRTYYIYQEIPDPGKNAVTFELTFLY